MPAVDAQSAWVTKSSRYLAVGSRMVDAGRQLERRVLLWMCVLIAVNQLGFGSIIPVLPLYAQSFGVSASAIGLAVAIYGLARFLLAVPSGKLSDQLGRRPALALGGLLSAFGNLWCALADGYPEFLVARFVAGAGAGLVLTTGAVVLADISEPKRRGRTMAIYQGVFLFAVGIGPLPGGMLAERFGLAVPFMAYAIASLSACAVAWFAVPETVNFRREHRNEHAGPSMSFVSQLQLLFRHTGFLLASLISFTNAVSRTGGLFSIVPVLGSIKLGLSAAQIGLGMALGSLLGLVVTYPGGVLVDRYGRKAVIVPTTLFAAASFLTFCVAPSYPWFVAACICWGTATALGGAAPAAYAADSAPPGMNAAAMSTHRMLGDFGYVVGPVGLGLIVDLFGTQVALVVAAVLLAAAGLVFARFAPESFVR